MAIELRAGNSYGTLLRIASIVGSLASVGLMIWVLVQHWQTFMAWKTEAGYWSFFASVAVLPLLGISITRLLVLAGATFELLPALAGCVAFAVNLTLSHLLARRFLRNWLVRMAQRRQYVMPNAGSRSRLTALLLVRITPGPPPAFKNYVGAFFEAPFAAYLAIYWTTTMLYALAFLVLGVSLISASMFEGAASPCWGSCWCWCFGPSGASRGSEWDERGALTSLVCKEDLFILLRGRKVLAAWLYRSYATIRCGYA